MRIVVQARRMTAIPACRAGLKGLAFHWMLFWSGVYPLSSMHWPKTKVAAMVPNELGLLNFWLGSLKEHTAVLSGSEVLPHRQKGVPNSWMRPSSFWGVDQTQKNCCRGSRALQTCSSTIPEELTAMQAPFL